MAKKKEKNLVIVESPAKARTLAGLLGPGYEIQASVGHVRDLPKSRLGVDIDTGFQPSYVVPREKQAVVRALKQAAAAAATVFLATDPDREGEAIAWHIVEAANLEKVPHRRVVFHEITEEAVQNAFRHPRDINQKLVDAQQARRILDRLVGYQISPLLWKKVRRGLSAGRVQSVALRMVVEREREIEGFQPQEYWTIDATLAKETAPDETFVARFVGPAGKRKKLEIGSREQADALLQALRSARYSVDAVNRKEQRRRPQPPFITSTLQQEASRRLGFSARHTMALAQQLYEGLPLPGKGQVGLITYMRTDSTHIAESALHEARACIAERFGPGALPPAPRVYRKKAKGAQEAHEAIRPTSLRRDPESLRNVLKRDQHRLYSLIWRRMLASQMKDALYDVTSVEIEAAPPEGEALLLRASETTLRSPGYRQVYQEYSDETEDEGKRSLPELTKGDILRLLDLLPEQHFTEPPPRYTEATLVKAMEENGIGRPSTYAPILSTIQQRGYIERENRYLKPTELGFVVNDLLTSYFPDIVEVGFTAEMEEELDEIAGGQREWQPVVRDFFEPLQSALAKAAEAPPVQEETGEMCPECGRPLVARWGRFGRFLACSGFPECRFTRPLEKEEEEAQEVPNEFCDLCGSPMVVRRGRYGRFLACSNYPKCKGTRRLLAKVGVACPDCGGDIVAKRTRRGRTFYGCSNYPSCRFTTWSRPLPEKCPRCGGPLTTQAGGKARCLKCSWKGPLPSRLVEVPA